MIDNLLHPPVLAAKPSRGAPVAWALAWLAAAVLLVALTGPASPERGVGGLGALTAGVLAGQDTLAHDYPAAWWGWGQIRSTGQLPLWNPSWFCGGPFIASQTFMPFYPPNWLGAVLPFPLAFNIQYPLHLFLAAAVMAWACRRRGFGWLAAGLAGLSWGLGGHLATLAGPGHIQKLQTLVWLPAVTLGAGRLAAGRRDGAAPLAVGLALQITAGHLQIVYLTLIAAGLEATGVFIGGMIHRKNAQPGAAVPQANHPAATAQPVPYATSKYSSAVSGENVAQPPPAVHPEPHSNSWLRLRIGIAWGALATVAALGLSAAFLVPTIEFARLSNRQGALTWEDATRGSLPPEEAVEFILPRLRGDSMPHGRGAYHGRYGESITSAPERIVSDYVGAGVLLFALWGLLATPPARAPARRAGNIINPPGRRAAWGWTTLAAGALLISLGKYNPAFYRWALGWIPGLAHFRSPSTTMALLAYGLTLAAAVGVETFFHSDESDPVARKEASRLRTWGMACIALMGIWFYGFGHSLTSAMDGKSPDIAGPAIAHFSGGLFIIAGLAGLWAALRYGIHRLPKFKKLAPLILALLAAAWAGDLVANDRAFWNAEREAPYRTFLTRHWALGEWARAPQPVRYIEVGSELSNRALTLSNFRAGVSIGSALGYHPVGYGRYFRLMDALGYSSPAFQRLFGIGWLIWPEGLSPLPGGGWREMGDPRQREAPGKLLLFNPSHHYLRPVRQFLVVADWPALIARLKNDDFDPAATTLLLAGDLTKGVLGDFAGLDEIHSPIDLEATVVPRAPGETLLRTRTRTAGIIEIAEPAVPGWRLWIDGRPSRPLPMGGNGYFLLVPVPAGRHELRLVYDPASQRLGLYLTLLTLGAVAFFLARKYHTNQ